MKLFGNSTQTKKGGKGKRSKTPVLLAILIVVFGAIIIVPKATLGFWPWEFAPVKPGSVTPPARASVTMGGQTEPDDDSEGALGTQPLLPEGDYKKDFFTVILAGTDEDDFHTDVLMVASFDYVNHKVDVVSVPRDTMVNVKRVTKKVNAAYGVGKGKSSDSIKAVETGAEQLKKELQTILGFQPSHYIFVKYAGFERLVNEIGGVYYDVPVNMTDDWRTFSVKKGYQLLNGKQALNLCRYRGYSSGDLGRIATSQSFLKEVFKQTVTADNIPKIPALIDTVSKNVSSDLSPGNMLWLAQEIAAIEGGMDGANINFYQLPISGMGSYQGQSYVYADKNETIKLVNKTINPYIEPISADNVDIIRLSGSGSSGSAKTSSPNSSSNSSTKNSSSGGKTDSSGTGSSGKTSSPAETPDPSATPSASPEPGGWISGARESGEQGDTGAQSSPEPDSRQDSSGQGVQASDPPPASSASPEVSGQEARASEPPAAVSTAPQDGLAPPPLEPDVVTTP